jgi:glucose/arabinose dehydrogenase
MERRRRGNRVSAGVEPPTPASASAPAGLRSASNTPDRALWITTGEAYHRELAQDRSSLNGKILRLPLAKARGPGGRPEIVSLGHRNVQGIDWQPGSGLLFITEFGAENRDEVNITRRGGNYG